MHLIISIRLLVKVEHQMTKAAVLFYEKIFLLNLKGTSLASTFHVNFLAFSLSLSVYYLFKAKALLIQLAVDSSTKLHLLRARNFSISAEM